MKDVFIFLTKKDCDKTQDNEFLRQIAQKLENKTENKDNENDDNAIRLGLFISPSFKDFNKEDIDNLYNTLDSLGDVRIEYCFSLTTSRRFRYLSTIVEVLLMQKDISVSYQGKLTFKNQDKVIEKIKNEKIKLCYHSFAAKGRIARFLNKNYT